MSETLFTALCVGGILLIESLHIATNLYWGLQ